jgi:hypothetical protein
MGDMSSHSHATIRCHGHRTSPGILIAEREDIVIATVAALLELEGCVIWEFEWPSSSSFVHHSR